MKVSLQNISGIDCLTALSNDPQTAVVMLHGYGANMQDLFPLWEMWHQPNFNWYFPNGVLPLPMGYYEGRAWFSIDMEALERAMREGTTRDMAGSIPPEFDSTLNQLETFLREIASKHSRIILGGFSQGAMCTSHLALRSGLPIEGIVLLSGSLLAEKKIPAQSKGISFYQSHGTRDPILPICGAKLLHEKLLSLNFSGTMSIFDGGHEIPMSVIDEVKSFLGQFAQK